MNTITNLFLQELEAEQSASRKCLELIPASVYNWKPHEKSMKMGDLAIMVADMPKWLSESIIHGEIDLAKWQKFSEADMPNLVSYLDSNIDDAKKALHETSDEALTESKFILKMDGEILSESPAIENISSILNHWVHHRAQLTVYMRLNDIKVPSIYGPSADENTF